MDKSIIKFNIYGLCEKICCILVCLIFCLFIGCGDSSEQKEKKTESKVSAGTKQSEETSTNNQNFTETDISETTSEDVSDVQFSSDTTSKKKNDSSKTSSKTVSSESSKTSSKTVSSESSKTTETNSKEVGSKKPSKENTDKNDSKSIWEGYSDTITRTYISMPAETEKQQFEVIMKRVGKEAAQIKPFPQPQKIEHFVNTPQNLYATAIYTREELDKIIYDNILDYFTTDEGKSGSLGTKYFYNKPEWWDINYKDIDICIMAYKAPVGYAYYDPEDGGGICDTSQKWYIAALEIEDSDMCRVYFGCQTGLPDELVDNPECYRD